MRSASGASAARSGATSPDVLTISPCSSVEHRAFPVGLVVLLVPNPLHRDQTDLGEPCQQSVHRAGARSGEADQLVALEAAIGLAEK